MMRACIIQEERQGTKRRGDRMLEIWQIHSARGEKLRAEKRLGEDASWSQEREAVVRESNGKLNEQAITK
jgi:hypothetical protein